MHFVTGGAFNGKLAWVKNFYKLQENNEEIYRFYRKDEKKLNFTEKKTIVLSGLEFFLKNYEKSDTGRRQFQQQLYEWIEWEKNDKERQLILIGTDMSKGVVPMNKEDRLFRDFVGWCYQDVVRKANRVDIIWYGINETIKMEGSI